MLTVKESLIYAGARQPDLTTRYFRTKFPNARPLSLRSVSRAVDQQTFIAFVDLFNFGAVNAPGVNTAGDFFAAARGPQGQPTADGVKGFIEQMAFQNISVRYITKDFRKAALVGPVSSFALLRTIPPVDAGNTQYVAALRDGAEEVAAGLVIAGVVTIGVALAPVSALTLLFFAGVALVDAGAGLLIGDGLAKMLAPPTSTGPQPNTNSSTNQKETPNDVPPAPSNDPPANDPPPVEQGTISVPICQVIGEPPHGLDAAATANDVAGLVLAGTALDDEAGGLPIGWDSDAGEPIIGAVNDIGGPEFGGSPGGGGDPTGEGGDPTGGGGDPTGGGGDPTGGGGLGFD